MWRSITGWRKAILRSAGTATTYTSTMLIMGKTLHYQPTSGHLKTEYTIQDRLGNSEEIQSIYISLGVKCVICVLKKNCAEANFSKMLNEKSELISKCRHQRKFLLINKEYGWHTIMKSLCSTSEILLFAYDSYFYNYYFLSEEVKSETERNKM